MSDFPITAGAAEVEVYGSEWTVVVVVVVVVVGCAFGFVVVVQLHGLVVVVVGGGRKVVEVGGGRNVVVVVVVPHDPSFTMCRRPNWSSHGDGPTMASAWRTPQKSGG